MNALSLRHKINVAIIIAYFAVSIILSFIYIYIQADQERKEIEHQRKFLSLVTQKYERDFANEIFDERFSALNLHLQKILEQDFIIGVALSDTDGNPIALQGKIDLNNRLYFEPNTTSVQNSSSGRTVHFKKKITYMGEDMGFIHFNSSLEEFDQKKKENFYFFMGMLFMTLVTMLSVLNILFSLIILHPVKILRDAMLRMQKGNWEGEQVKIKNKDELGQLSETFNSMSTELRNLTSGLEIQIKKRTQKLDDALKKLELTHEEVSQMNGELALTNEELALTNQELVQTYNSLKKTQRTLVEREKMASLGRLVAGLAHEINTPVGVSVTAASSLEDKVQEIRILVDQNQLRKSEFDSFLSLLYQISGIISRNLKRTANLVNNFKKVSTDRSRYSREHFALVPYIQEVLQSLSPEIKKTQLKFSVLGNEALTLNSFPGVIAQIVSNLVLNSIKHGFDEGDTGELIFEVMSLDEDNVQLLYSDNGKGAEEEVVQQIFEPFFTTKLNQGGTGLGMHIVYNLVQQNLSGTISCKSTLGKGISFTLIFPTNTPD